MNTEIDLDSVALDPEPMTTAIGAAASTTHVGVSQDHSTGLLTTTSHVIEAPAPTAAVVIHPTTDIPGMPPEITADLAVGLENTTTNQPKAPSSSSHTASWKSKDRKHKHVTIDDLLSDYYSSDDTNSDLDDDLN